MIRGFASKATEDIWDGTASRRLPVEIQNVARRKLRMLNNAVDIRELTVPPNNRLEKLKGDRVGQYSIRINDQWRICFQWIDGDAYEVEIVDYQ